MAQPSTTPSAWLASAIAAVRLGFVLRSEFQSPGGVGMITVTLTRSSKGVPSITVFRPRQLRQIFKTSYPIETSVRDNLRSTMRVGQQQIGRNKTSRMGDKRPSSVDHRA